MGDAKSGPFRLSFNPQLRVEIPARNEHRAAQAERRALWMRARRRYQTGQVSLSPFAPGGPGSPENLDKSSDRESRHLVETSDAGYADQHTQSLDRNSRGAT